MSDKDEARLRETAADYLAQLEEKDAHLGEWIALADRLGRMLLDVEGCILAYWTDIPESECQRLVPAIRAAFGDFEPASVSAGSREPA